MARFIGGHNVVTANGARLAVRADRLRLRRLNGHPVAAHATGTVTNVEYQGTAVQTSVAADDGTELIALAPEQTFDQEPLTPGTRVTVDWEPDAAHPLV